jgi:hypothetical protein
MIWEHPHFRKAMESHANPQIPNLNMAKKIQPTLDTLW